MLSYVFALVIVIGRHHVGVISPLLHQSPESRDSFWYIHVCNLPVFTVFAHKETSLLCAAYVKACRMYSPICGVSFYMEV